MDRRRKLVVAVAGVCLLGVSRGAEAQWSVTDPSATYTVNFDTTVEGVNNGQWAGTGFQQLPLGGQLDSDAWAITGFTDGNLLFGGTRSTASDYTRGVATATVTAGGIYAFRNASITSGTALGIQPAGGDFIPGTITLRFRNDTGSMITGFDLGYKLWVRNDQARGNSFNFSHSADDATYNPVEALDYTSGAAPENGSVFVLNDRSTKLSGLSIAPNAYYYLRWSGADVSGTGSRDEFGLDDITLSAIAVNTTAARNLVWAPAPGATGWGVGGTNFTHEGNSTPYASGDHVTFTNTGVGEVTVAAGGVQAGNVTFEHTAGTYSVSGGAISGTGSLTNASAGRVVLSGGHAYSGGTNVNAGTLLISSTPAGASATGSGPVMVQAPGALGGFGRIAGAVTVHGRVSPGEDGPGGGSVGVLTLSGGADFATPAGGTYAWGLGALSTENPGVNFDQLVVDGGNLSMGGGRMTLSFDNGLAAPAAGEAFWTTPHAWKVVDFSGGGTSTGLFTLPDGNFGVGSFTLEAGAGADAGDVLLVYSPASSTAPRRLLWRGDAAAPAGAADADGLWPNSNVFWDPVAGEPTDWDSFRPDRAVFGTGTGPGAPVNVTLRETVTVGDMTIAADSRHYTFNSVDGAEHGIILAGPAANDLVADSTATINVPITIGGEQTWSVGAGQNLMVNKPVSGAHPLTKVGAGTLTLSGAPNTFSSLTIVEGTVSTGDDAALGAAGAAVTLDGGTLQSSVSFTTARPISVTVNNGSINTAGGDLTATGVISGAGTLTKSGAGVLTLSGNNTIAGGFVASGAGSVLAVSSDANLGAEAAPIRLAGGGTLRAPAGFASARPVVLEVQNEGGVIDVPAGAATLTGAITGELLTKVGAGDLVLPGTNFGGRTRNTNVNAGRLVLASADANGVSPLGTGAVNVKSGAALVIDRVRLGYRPDGSRGTGLTMTLEDGGSLVGTGIAAATGTLNFSTIGTTRVVAPASGDSLLLGSSIRNAGAGGTPSTGTISVEGAGVVRLASGGTSTSPTGTQFTGSWQVNMAPEGVLWVGVEPGGFGETLNAFGYGLGNSRGPGRPVTVNWGTLAIGVDTHNPAGANTPMGGITSIRSPITLAGGNVASTGMSIDLAATTTTTGAVFSSTPVAAKFSNDFTVAAGKTSKVLLYDPLDPSLAPVQTPRDVHIMTETATPAVTGLTGNLAWLGTLELDPGTSTGGALHISRDLAATNGTVQVGDGASIVIKSGAGLKLSGPGNTLVDSADPSKAVDIVNQSSIAGTGVHVSGAGNHVLGRVSGPGRMTAAGGSTTARLIRQNILEITDGASVTLAPRTPGMVSRVNTLTFGGSAAGGWQGKLDIANNGLIVEGGSLADVSSQVRQGYGAGDWAGTGGITSSTAAADAADGLSATGVAVIRNSDDGTTPIMASFGGLPVTANSILVRHTYHGDSDLNGTLSADDLGRADRGFISQQDESAANDLTGYRWGDANHDGKTNISDFLLIDGALGLQRVNGPLTLGEGGPLAASGPLSAAASAVPEPATLSLLAVGGLGLLRRRRR